MVLDDPDQVTKTKTIYDVSASEIIWRNFLAGISRAVGGMVVYFLVAFLLGHVFLTFVWPILEPSIESLGKTGDVLQQLKMFEQSSTFQ